MGTRSNSVRTFCDARRCAHERCKDHIAGRERPEHDADAMPRLRGALPRIRTRIGSWRAGIHRRATRRSGSHESPAQWRACVPGLRNLEVMVSHGPAPVGQYATLFERSSLDPASAGSGCCRGSVRTSRRSADEPEGSGRNSRSASAFLPVAGEIQGWDGAGRIRAAVCAIARAKTVQGRMLRRNNGATS
jgi:hypothetical protein